MYCLALVSNFSLKLWLIQVSCYRVFFKSFIISPWKSPWYYKRVSHQLSSNVRERESQKSSLSATYMNLLLGEWLLDILVIDLLGYECLRDPLGLDLLLKQLLLIIFLVYPIILGKGLMLIQELKQIISLPRLHLLEVTILS